MTKLNTWYETVRDSLIVDGEEPPHGAIQGDGELAYLTGRLICALFLVFLCLLVVHCVSG